MKKLLWIIFVVFCIQNLNAQDNIFIQHNSAISIQFKDLKTPFNIAKHIEVHSKVNAISYPKEDHLRSYPQITPAQIIEKKYSVNDFDSNEKFAALFEEKEIGEVDISYTPDFVFKDRSKLNLKYLDKPHGFFSNFIYNIQQDKDGIIWLSSPDGLCRLDGKEMIVYTDKSGLPTSSIQYIFYDSNDRLWIGSLNGICYISNQKLYVPKFDFLDSTSVLFITEDRNNDIWFGTDGDGAYHFQNDTLIRYNTQSGLPGDLVRAVAQDNEENYWFGFDQKGICKFDGQYFTHYNTVKKNLHPCQVIKEDENGIWFGFFYDPILYYDGSSFYEYQFLEYKNISVNSIFSDKDRLWLVDYGNGLIEYSKGGKRVVNITNIDDGLTNRNSLRGFIDNNQNIWIAHLFGGISRLDDPRFSIPDNQIMKLIGTPFNFHTEANGDIWYLQNGRSILKEDSDRYMVYSDIYEGKNRLVYVNDMEPFEDNSYFFTILNFGICFTDLKKSTYYTFDNVVTFRGVEKGINGSYWFMSDNAGLFKYSNGKFYNLNKDNGLLSNKLSAIHTDKNGQLWVANLYGGLNIIKDNKIASLHEEDGLSSGSINCFFEDDNDGMWIGTSNGINILYPDKTIRINKNTGLVSDRIRSITKDSLGYYWIATTEGLSKIKWIDEHHIQVENYDKNDGININDFNSAVLSLKDGKVKWGNTNSIVQYKPDKNRISQRNISIKFDDKCFADSITENYEIKNGKVEIQPNGQFNISFTAIDWGNEANITYQYSIISKEKDTVWNDLGQGSRYLLRDIENGEYQFLAKATIKGKETEIIGLNFRIIPFWWETKEFALIIIVVFLFSGPIAFYRYSKMKNREQEKLEILVNEKTSELQKENKIKDALVQEIHHRVKNNLQSISSLVDMQLRTLSDDSKRKVLIDTQLRIGAMALVHEMLYSTDDFSQVSVRDYLNALVFSINEMVNPEKLPIEFNINTINHNLNISDCISFGILTSEVISNSIKYAFGHIEKPKIDINFSIEDDTIIYTIEDNGVGLKETDNKKPGSLGMRLIDVFSRQLNAKLSIENNPGVLVRLQIPLKN